MKGKRHFVKSMLGVGLALLLCMICFSAPVAAQASIHSGTCGENVTWEYDTVTKTLTISGKGAMKDYPAQFAYPWNSFRMSIEKVIIQDGVTSVGDYAFIYCPNITELTIPNSVTRIGDYAFHSLAFLTELTIPDRVTYIGDYAFNGMVRVSKITIPDSVTYIGEGAFYSCHALTEITIPDSVTSIGKWAFYDCDFMTKVTIGDGVTSIGDKAFYYCDKLTTINASCKWKAAIESGNFYGASKIKTVNMHHAGARCYTADDTEKSITSVCEGCGEVYGSVTLLDPDAGAKIMYDGTAKTTKYEGEIPGVTPVITYTGATATNGKAVNAGTYTATMTVGGQKVSVQFVIEKLEWAPNAPQTVMTVPYTVSKLNTVSLPSYWSWQTPNTDLVVGRATEATAVYRGADRGNYRNEAVVVRITRSACVHRGGTATCNEKATCDVCGVKYGNFDTTNHGESVVRNQKAATCTTAGYTGDTCCRDCGTVLVAGKTIAVKGHGETELRNQSEPGFNKNGYTGDTYCKDCGSLLEKGVEIPMTSGTCGENMTWEHDEDTNTLIIGGEGEMPGEEESSNIPWDSLREEVENIVIGDGVTDIGDNAFSDFDSLKEVTIPDSVTSIGDGAFSDCDKLTTINLSCKWKADVESGNFFGAENIETVNFHHEIAEGADICYCGTTGTCGENVIWVYDEAMSTLTISGEGAMAGYGSNASTPWYGFCSIIKNVVIEDGVTSIGQLAFCNCDSLTKVTIPDSVTSMGKRVFCNCDSLTKVTIPDSVTSIDTGAFYGCTSLTEVTIPDSVTSIDTGAFYGCTSLTEVTIPDSVTDIWPDAFYGCTSLTEVTIPDSVTSIDTGAFYGCTSLTEVTIPDSVTHISMNVFKNCTNLTTINLGCNWKSKVDSGNFYGATNIETVNMHHVGDACFTADKTEKSITLACEKCKEVYGAVTLLDPDADAKIVYDGTSKTTKYEGEIPGETPVITYTGITATNGEAVKAGTYTATMTVGGQKVSVQFVIEKLEWASNAPQKTVTVPYTMTKVKDVVLPENWAWQKSYTDLELTVGEVREATALYNGADKGNYKNEAVIVEITRAACVHEGGVATCIEMATCDVCGEQYGELDSANHGEEEVCNQSEASCTVNGYTGDTCCADCGTVLEKGEAIEAKGHIGGTATCVEKAACDVCGEQYGEVDATNHGEEVLKNQTEATCVADGYTGDTCCKDCDAVLVAGEVIAAKGHIGGTATCVEKAVCDVCDELYGEFDSANHGEKELRNQTEATCTEEGYTGDTCCNDCSTVLEAGEVIAAKGHIGGTATCVEEAVCDVCGEKYGELATANHGEKELRNQTGATCTEEGYTGDTCCKDCGAVLVSGEAIVAKGHIGGTATCVDKATCDVCGEIYGETDSTNHGEEILKNQSEATCTEEGYTGDTCCNDCSTVLEAGEVIAAKGHIGGTATCIEEAVCDVCGEKYGELDSANHGEKELRNQTEATCTKEGYTGDTCCKDCGAVLEAGEAIVAKGHIGGTATCVDKATCDVCGEKYGETDSTNHGEEVLKNQTEATCTEEGYTGDTCCKDCGAVLEAGEAVAMKEHVGGTATCTEKAVCEVCGSEYNGVDAENHGEEVLRNQTEATCVADGYTGDICCSDCGTVFVAGEAIIATGHEYKSVVTKEPTTAENGVRTYTCEKCGDTYTEEIEKLPEILIAEVTYATHGQIEITLTNKGETILDGWEAELDLNFEAKLSGSWGDGYVSSFENGHVCITNQSWETSFEAGTTKKVYLQFEGTLPNLITCIKSDEVLVARINYQNHWGNGGQIEICLENLGETINGSWSTELDINLIGTMTNTWGDGYVTSYENGHIVIENQSWATGFEAGATKSIWLQYEGVLPIYASNAVIK